MKITNEVRVRQEQRLIRVLIVSSIGTILIGLILFLTGNLFPSDSKASTPNGSVSAPFTALNLASSVTSAGTYYFDLEGSTFSSYVDTNGYVLVAVDFGNKSGNLPRTASLDHSSRGILQAELLSSLTSLNEIRISTSTNVVDVTTSDSTLIDRLQRGLVLHQGKKDNDYNNDWSGTNAAWFTANASCNSGWGDSLHQNIYHPCGNAGTFHWLPSGGYQREKWNQGEAAGTTAFYLWVKDTTQGILPVELLRFSASKDGDYNKLEWATSMELNNYYFTIERSTNGSDFEELDRIPGQGTTSDITNYTYEDVQPFDETYYRLKQTDFDGTEEHLSIKVVRRNEEQSKQLKVYPNPCFESTVHVRLSDLSGFDNSLQVLDMSGRVLKNIDLSKRLNNDVIDIKVDDLPRGFYIVQYGSDGATQSQKLQIR